MKKLLISLSLILILTGTSYSWDLEAAKFFPMASGNSWTYVHKIYAPPFGCYGPISSYNFKIFITGDTVFNMHRYYRFSNGGLYRLDSSTMNVYKWTIDRDCMSDSLLARYHDWVTNCSSRIQVQDTANIVFAMQKRPTKMVGFPGYRRTIMYGIGLYDEGGCEVTSGTVDELKGCVINGELIGDTAVMAQSYDYMNYMPLSVGNRWTWNRESYYSPGPGIESMLITGIRIISNKLYYSYKYHAYTYYGSQSYFSYGYCRIDSTNGNFYTYDSVNAVDCLIDSLKANKGDSARSNCTNQWFRCDTGTYNIFYQDVKTKNYNWSSYFEAGSGKKYGYAIGKVYALSGAVMNWTFWYLKGCVINGVVKGDTNMYLGINKISSEVPDHFSLSQNCPNPFNPTTKIRFSIPLVGNGRDRSVRVTIYDALGREVQTLVNEQLQPGTYEVEWDGSNFSSGVYYYTLSVRQAGSSTGDYFETKRMVMIK